MTTQEKLEYGTTTIAFELSYAHRNTLAIRVLPNRKVEVVAPLLAEREKVFKKVKSKAAWILKQQAFFLTFEPRTPERKYISGETHLYLGKRYRLKVKKSKEESVKLLGAFIIIKTTDPKDTNQVEKQLKQWYKSKAALHFPKLFQESVALTKKYYEQEPTLKYRWMKKRWGSCSPSDVITLNLELIKTPKECIRYVIVHECCHLVHLNHSSAFFQLLEKNMPDWKKTKEKLELLMV